VVQQVTVQLVHASPYRALTTAVVSVINEPICPVDRANR